MLSGKLNRGSLLVKASSGIRGHAYNYWKKKKKKWRRRRRRENGIELIRTNGGIAHNLSKTKRNPRLFEWE